MGDAQRASIVRVRTPMRVSFVGGGSDIPTYYRRRSGAVVSTTIDKYVRLRLRRRRPGEPFTIRYSEVETVGDVRQVRHPLVRECLHVLGGDLPFEVDIEADLPPAQGLGSSSALCVGLLHGLHRHLGRQVTPDQLASLACRVEIERCRAPIGKQDQYAAAFGGLNTIRFLPDETVTVEPLRCPQGTLAELERRLLAFGIGERGPAARVLDGQVREMEKAEAQDRIKSSVDLVTDLRRALETGDLAQVGPLLHEAWRLKSGLTRRISNGSIDQAYAAAKAAGATGGKVLGAGGGGFLLLFCEPSARAGVREALRSLPELPFRFTAHGSTTTVEEEFG